MNLNKSTLIEFEQERSKNNHVPPEGSNSFYTIGDGEINIHVDNHDDCKLYLLTNKGRIHTGKGEFLISSNDVYTGMNIIENTQLIVDDTLIISDATLEVHGTLELTKGSQLIIRDGGSIVCYSDSKIIIADDTVIRIQGDSSLTIYGNIDIHLNRVNNILNTNGIIIDTAAIMNVKGLEALGNRVFSLTDYFTELSNRVINKHTQGEKNYPGGRLGYTWKGGNPLTFSQYIQISVLWGRAILGDFKLSVMGLPETDIPNYQMISNLHVNKNTTLYITEDFEGCKYVNPKLYLGPIIGNNSNPANCTVDGTMIVSGENASVNVDRKSIMIINGEVRFENGAQFISSYNDDYPVLFINGTLIIETIEQINTFNRDNIVFGDNGKLVVLNPETEERKLLWTTPNGIHDTDLYRLFEDRINHVEYHISKNNGIGIDQYFEFYATQMTQWYGGRRFEKAIHDGILVWHDGAFMELYADVIPWVDEDCTLLQASRLFKTYGSFDKDKLQEATDRLRYAGCGSIQFRFVIDDDIVKEVYLNLEDIKMENIINSPLTNMYNLRTSNDGQLFIRNKIGTTDRSKIINEKSRVMDVEDKKVSFNL